MKARMGVLVVVALAATLVLPLAATANMANPVAPGDAVGEPSGELAGLHIERESLELDLRPLAEGSAARIDATYHVRNDGEARSVDLVFVAAGLSDEAHGVWLDGTAVDFRSELVNSFDPPADVPWRPPQTTPGLSGGTNAYSARYEGVLRFTLLLTPGTHQIRVSYPATATAVSGAGPVRLWQLGYVLSPARQWASFGTLDVLVRVPAGWSFASDPQLQRSGDEARGTFQGVPADAIGITAQYPYSPVPAISFPLIGAVIVVGMLLAALLGVVVGRRGWRPRNAWPMTLAYSIGASALAVFYGRTLMGGIPAIPDSQRSWNAYQGVADAIAEGLQMLLLMPLLAVVLFLLMQWFISFVARRAGRAGALQPQTGR
jgi:hypothetical protein